MLDRVATSASTEENASVDGDRESSCGMLQDHRVGTNFHRLREILERTKQEPLFEIEKDAGRYHPRLTNRVLGVRRLIGIGLNHADMHSFLCLKSSP